MWRQNKCSEWKCTKSSPQTGKITATKTVIKPKHCNGRIRNLAARTVSTTATRFVSKQIAVENLLILGVTCCSLLPACSPSDSSNIISSVSIRPSDTLSSPASQISLLGFVSRRGQSPSRVRSFIHPRLRAPMTMQSRLIRYRKTPPMSTVRMSEKRRGLYRREANKSRVFMTEQKNLDVFRSFWSRPPSIMPAKRFGEMCQIGLDFFEFLKETNRASITERLELREIYNTEFRSRSVVHAISALIIFFFIGCNIVFCYFFFDLGTQGQKTQTSDQSSMPWRRTRK